MAKRMKYSPIQESAPKVFTFIMKHYGEKRYMPTTTEIGKEFKKSGEWARRILIFLESEGYIKVQKGKRRGIKIL